HLIVFEQAEDFEFFNALLDRIVHDKLRQTSYFQCSRLPGCRSWFFENAVCFFQGLGHWRNFSTSGQA
ncbi:MAG: hypothetical protein ACLFOY_11360, partial [Desulfatibacillaceae bacterium]